MNRQVPVTSPLGRRSTTVYDLAGQVTASVDPLGNRTSYAYDNAGNQTSVTNPLGFITTSVYSANSNRMSASVDPLGNRTSYACDSVIAHHHAIIASDLRGEINSVNLFLESNAECGDARGGSYSVGEGQLTNGNYGEYELPGFPRDWNPFVEGPARSVGPPPPYKKPPRKNPPPVELPSVPTPAPADRGLLPGNADAKELVAKLKFVVCMGCCLREVIGGGPFMPFVDWIGDVINVPKLECTGSDRYEIGKAEGVPSIGNMDDFVEEFCKQLGIPEILCRPAPLPGGQEEWIPGPVKDFIDKLNKGINACNKLTCFVECGLQLKEGLDQAHIPDPWQVCGRESDEESCITCCAEKLGARAIHPVFKECKRQCSLHYY